MTGLTVRVKFDPHDLWVGTYWRRTGEGLPWYRWAVYVCLVPMFPIRVTWFR